MKLALVNRRKSVFVLIPAVLLVSAPASFASNTAAASDLANSLADAAALVRTSRLTKNADLACRAETSIDDCISKASRLGDKATLNACQAIRMRLSNICILPTLDSPAEQEVASIETELLRLSNKGTGDIGANYTIPLILIATALALLAAALLFVLAKTKRSLAEHSTMRKQVTAKPDQIGARERHATTVFGQSASNRVLSMMDEILPLASSSRDLTYFDNVPIGLVSVNEKGNVRSANLRFAAMTGLKTSEFSGKSIVHFLKVSNRESESPSTYDSMRSQLPDGSCEGWLRHGEANWIPVDITAADFASAHGKGTLISVADRTSRQQVEELRRQFVSMVSHDLAAPLSSLGLFFALIRHSSAYQSEDYRLAVESAESETNRLMKLVTDLLDISKLESGKFSLALEDTEPRELANESISSVRNLAEQKQITIANRCTAATIRVDKQRMVQVLVNLLVNAIKFSPINGKILIEGGIVSGGFELSVTDEGPGVPPEYREVIFDRFAQASPSDKKQGTGLGLAICKLIVQQHGGQISVSAADPQGARFTMLIPCD